MTSIRSLRQEPFQFFQGITKSYFTHYSYTLFVVQFNADLCCPVFLEFLFRSSYRRCCAKKGALISFAKPTRKYPRPSLSFNKAAGLRSATLLKKRLQHRRFPANLARPPRLQEHSLRGTPPGDCLLENQFFLSFM